MIEKTPKQDKETQQPEQKSPDATKLRPIGLDKGKVWISDNFNDPMPDDFMKAFE
jgi:hypothetical protein